MRDLFLEDGADMVQETERRPVDAAEEIRDALAGRHVCPFCGMTKDHADGPCPRCTMENTAHTRQATKARIGPWYVLQGRNPAAPGMKFQTLLTFVQKGKIKPRSIVRGPTTHQLWRFAAHVRGLSREFGICYSCGGEIERTANLCPHCNRLQEPPVHPDLFLESEPEIPGMSRPVYREISEPPLVGEDIVAPAAPAARATEPKPKPKRGADGFLSAQDLAAAFKLNFTPRDEPAGKTSADANQGVSRMRSRTKRHPRWKRWVFLLLVLAAAGAFTFQYRRDSNFRTLTWQYLDQGKQWAGRAGVWVRQTVANLQENANRSARSSTTQPARQPVQVSHEEPASRSQSSPAATQPGSPWDQILKTEAATPQPAPIPPPAPPARQGTQEQASADDIGATPPTLDEARSLYRSAIDAEDQGDYTAAVKKYEQIHKFPQDLWPRDLELRLKEARDRLR